ncbi:hypothetical protein GRI89_12785 [Altererythrobacter salegens]|uniref:PAS domain-containing protein n=1 Tax=Croceibacterium salegens TaxID=1737568 RepID=A0A6I4SX25_9SPHN|nr:hypothetical protein [Croceibacterium salegens]
MDTLRGSFGALDTERDYDAGEDDFDREAPPASIGTDERRMQVRAYNHWASLLEDRNFPAIDDLDVADLPDFGPYSVLLDFTAGIENPGIAYLGSELAEECEVTPQNLQTLSDVPARSLLSRITDHYMQILANQAPIGFEAEFVNQRGATILYRGILLPFSTDDEKIDFIYGVINWKELADQHTSDELLLQVDQALEQKPATAPSRFDDTPMTDWADGPGSTVANDIGDDDYAEEPLAAAPAPFGANLGYRPGEDEDEEDEDGPIDYAAKFGLNYDDDEEFEEGEGEEEPEDDGMPRPSFGSLTSIGGGLRKTERTAVLELPEDDQEFPETGYETESSEDAGDYAETYAPYEEPAGYEEPAYEAPEPESVPEYEAAPVAYEPAYEQGYEAIEDEPSSEIELAELDPADMELGDWLAAAREMAAAARTSEDRTRTALYEAIGRAYDFSLAATDQPEDFDELLVDSGLTMQDRAPMTPIVKLVFGADYDKTRVTEYAAALSHAHRLELPRGTLGDYLRNAEGGLKGVVQAERRMRKAESGKDIGEDPREALAEALRAMPAIELDDIDPNGAEFALVMIRRCDDGTIELVGEVPEDTSLLERAAKKLVG